MEKKSLYLVRHGKAEEHTFTKKDSERDLIQHGIARSASIAETLKQRLLPIDEKTLIISSTANRAAQTAKIFAEMLAYPAENIQWEPRIYEAHYLLILKCINDISANYDQVLVFGHNPGLSDLVEYVANEFVNLKTAHVACLTLEEGIDYASLSANTAKLDNILTEG